MVGDAVTGRAKIALIKRTFKLAITSKKAAAMITTMCIMTDAVTIIIMDITIITTKDVGMIMVTIIIMTTLIVEVTTTTIKNR